MWLWRNGHEPYNVHTGTMKIVLYMMDPRLRASPRHSGQGIFSNV